MYSTNHARSGFVSNEGVSKYLSKFTRSKGKMSSLTAQGSDAFLQSQEWLVDLRSFHPCLSVGWTCVRSSLISRQVYQRELPKQGLFVVIHSQDDLKDVWFSKCRLQTIISFCIYLKHCMTSGWVSIRTGLSGCSEVVAVGDQLQDVLDAVHLRLRQPDHHHLLLSVLQHS